MDLPLLIRAAAPLPSTPKFPPHMMDWNPRVPRGTGIPLMPSILRSGIATNPLTHSEDPAAGIGAGVVVPRIPKGSGEVVEDSFH